MPLAANQNFAIADLAAGELPYNGVSCSKCYDELKRIY